MQRTTKLQPRTKPPEARHEDLLNAAQSLFLKRGISATTIEQITTRAHVAKGTFYLYFSSKEDVLDALGEKFAQELLMRVKVAVAKVPAGDWRSELKAWAEACVNGYLDSMRVHDVIFYSSRPGNRDGLVKNIVVDHLAALIEAGAQAGAWKIGDPRVSAVFLFNGLHGVVDAAQLKKSAVRRNTALSEVNRLFLAALGLTANDN